MVDSLRRKPAATVIARDGQSRISEGRRLHQGTSFSLNGWLGEELYGFVERNDPVGEMESIVAVDAVRARDVDRFLDDDGVPTATLASLPSVTVVTKLHDKRDSDEESLEMPEASWQRVTLGSGTPAQVYPTLDAAPVATEAAIKALPQPKVRALAKKFSISHLFPKATAYELRHFLPDDVEQVAVYNVGQGSCSALCGREEVPRLYFDLGGGCLQNTRTYPRPLRFCTSRSPGVVLSHWDYDHWFSAWKVPRLARELRWLVPDQGSVGPQTLRFAATLRKARFWPGLASYSWSGGTLVKCTGRTRNDSGLALFAQTRGGTVLLPADSRFDFVPVPRGTGALRGLVATHHGSTHLGAPIPRPAPGAKLAYSFGHANSFGHPTDNAVALYEGEGWRPATRRDTPHGHIWLGSTSPPLACSQRRCDLTTVQ